MMAWRLNVDVILRLQSWWNWVFYVREKSKFQGLFRLTNIEFLAFRFASGGLVKNRFSFSFSFLFFFFFFEGWGGGGRGSWYISKQLR